MKVFVLFDIEKSRLGNIVFGRLQLRQGLQGKKHFDDCPPHGK